MIYEKISIKELKKLPYPNLMAEIIESGYSICTIAEHMGLPGRRRENDAEVWGKLKGKKEIMCTEAIGLARLFNVKFEYLFDHELKTFQNQSAAYWRWLDFNLERERELKESRERREIEETLKNDPYLFEFMKLALTWDKKEVQYAIALLKKDVAGGN